jgi:CDP-diglyceride synthetase
MVQCVVIAYTCDAGALFAGGKFGKTQFGGPITPSKTNEGVYGGFAARYFIII